MARSILQVLLVVVAAAAPALAETYDVEGEADGRGAFSGAIEVTPLQGDEVEVVQRLTFAATGETSTLAGRGRRQGATVEAELRPIAGASQALDRLGQATDAGTSTRLRLQLAPGRWRSRCDGALRCAGEGPIGAGADRPRTTSSATGWKTFEGTPFVRAPEDPADIHESDPRQGHLCDCYLMAGLIAVARTHPQKLRSMIAPRAGGEWTVTLKGAGSFLYVFSADTDQAVDRSYPVDASGTPVYAKLADQKTVGGKTVYELWPMMIERAYAQARGGYDVLDKGGNPAEVYGFVGGSTRTHVASTARGDAAHVTKLIDDALAAGKPVTLVLPKVLPPRLAADLHVIGWHCYVLTKKKDGGYVLTNPWGSSHPTRPVTAEELGQLAAKLQVGDL